MKMKRGKVLVLCVLMGRKNEIGQKEMQLKNLIGKFNDKFEARITDVEDQVLKFGKFVKKIDDTMTRQENTLTKQMEELKEDTWNRVGDAETKLERKVKEIEGGLQRGKQFKKKYHNPKNTNQEKRPWNISKKSWKAKAGTWRPESTKKARSSKCKWKWCRSS